MPDAALDALGAALDTHDQAVDMAGDQAQATLDSMRASADLAPDMMGDADGPPDTITDHPDGYDTGPVAPDAFDLGDAGNGGDGAPDPPAVGDTLA